jgi:hypothetical protein
VVKAVLRDRPRMDPPCVNGRVDVSLAEDSDVSPCDPVGPSAPMEVWPMVEVMLRSRSGFNEDGAPTYVWESLLESRGMLYTLREELDAEAGITRVTGKAVVANEAGVATLPETAVLLEKAENTTWRITSTAVTPQLISLDVERLAAGTGPLEEVTGGVFEWPFTLGQAVVFGHTGGLPPTTPQPLGTEFVDLDTGLVWMVE